MSELALHVDQTRAPDSIGASDGACALGCDRYKSALTLWKQLRGLPVNDEKPPFVEEAGEWGQLLEPIVRAKYALKTGSRVLVPERSFLIDDGWLRATPDGLAIRGVESAIGTEVWTASDEQRIALSTAIVDGRGGLLQVKTCSAYKLDDWEDGVPFEYEIQERIEMAVTDMPWADVVCLVGGQKFVGPFRIERDPSLEDRIMTDLEAFWRLVKEGVEPTPDHTEAWRQHAAERLEKIKAKVTMKADADLLAEIAAFRRARTAKKETEREFEELKNRILLRLADAGATTIELPDGRPLTAYQCGLKPKWKDYAISLGGQKKPPPQFMGTKNTWAIRLPESEPHETDNTEDDKES
jgi:predicted phage-related endonuclease